MLAAECAWAVLKAEHARMREWLDRLDRMAQLPAPEDPARHASTLLELIERVQAFDEATHRPKGTVLLDFLRGRSPEADALLAQLEAQRGQCDELLGQARQLLAHGAASDFGGVARLLQAHRRIMLDHLEKEDTLLHSQTALLLSREEWAAVASAISAAM